MFLKNIKFCVFICLFGLTAGSMFFCSMGPTQYAGGSASEGEAYTLSGKISYENGSAGANLPVFLREMEISGSGMSVNTSFADTTDLEGSYSFTGLSRGVYSMNCPGGEEGYSGMLSRIELTNDTALEYNNKIVLRESKTVKGRLIAENGITPSSIKVVIPGTGEDVYPDQNGFFHFSSVIYDRTVCAFIYGSTVNYLIFSVKQDYSDTVCLRDIRFQENALNEFTVKTEGFFSQESGIENSYVVFSEIYDNSDEPLWYDEVRESGKDFFSVSYYTLTGSGSLLEVDDNGKPVFLLDNFEDRDSYSELSTVNLDAIWTFKTDFSTGGNTAIIPSGILDDFSKGIVDSSVKGNAFHFGAVFGDGIANPYASVYIPLEKGDSVYADLTTLSNLRFYVKGTGTGKLRILFWTRKASMEYGDEYQREQLSSIVELPDYWYLATINLMDIVPPEGSLQEADSLKWEEARSQVSGIEFSLEGNPGDTAELYIDEIYLSGIEPADLY